MKRPLIYLGLAALAVLVVIAIENPFAHRVGTDGYDYFLTDYDSKDIVRIEIEQLIEGVELSKNVDGSWSVADKVTPAKIELSKSEDRAFPEPEPKVADSEKVNAALGIFGGLAKGVVVSSNPDNQKLYNVDPLSALHIWALNNNEEVVFDVYIGKNGPDMISTYIRKDKENDVYLVPRVLTGVFSPREDDWLKKEQPEQEPAQEAKPDKK